MMWKLYRTLHEADISQTVDVTLRNMETERKDRVSHLRVLKGLDERNWQAGRT